MIRPPACLGLWAWKTDQGSVHPRGIGLFVGLLVSCGGAPSGEDTARNERAEGSESPGPQATITPEFPEPGEALECGVSGTAAYGLRWFVDGESGVVQEGPRVPEGYLRSGERWTCEAWPTLGGAPLAVTVTVGPAPGGNILLVLLDDVGVDKVRAYGEHPSPPPTPNLDGLADRGLLFRNAYTSPTCSATRAAVLTGRLGRRTGIGDTVKVGESFELSLQETLIPELLKMAPDAWSTAAVGKWHLSGFDTPSGVDHPRLQGFDHFSGTLGNITEMTHEDGQLISYDHWEKTIDGEQAFVDRYLTTDQIDDALVQVTRLPEPWFVYLALNAPHSPLHVPPEGLHTSTADFSLGVKADYYDAMLEAADHELGRLLDGMSEDLLARTTVIVAGDNGTPDHSVRAPWLSARAKATLYEGGVNIPLLITGPHVEGEGRETQRLVHLVDLFPTVAALAGVPLAHPTQEGGAPLTLDGENLLPTLRGREDDAGRDVLYAERFIPNGPPPYGVEDARMVRDTTHKLVVDRDGGAQLFRYEEGRPDEGVDLMGAPLTPEDAVALDRLLSWVDAYGFPYEGAR